MNYHICSVGLVLFLQSFAGFLCQVTVHPPENKAVKEGTQSRLECWVDAHFPLTIEWWEYITNPTGARISSDNVIEPTHPWRDLVFLEHEYDLVIPNTGKQFGGTFKCHLPQLPAHNHYYAELVVMESPTCTSTTTQGSPEESVLTCTVNYAGNISPDVVWWDGNIELGGVISDRDGQRTARYTVAGTAAGIDRTYKCQVTFSKGSANPDYDQTVPDFEDMCTIGMPPVPPPSTSTASSTTPTITSTSESPKDSASNLEVIIACSAVIGLAVIGIIVLVVMCKRRKNNRHPGHVERQTFRPQYQYREYDEPNISPDVDRHEYLEIKDSNVGTPATNPYANSPDVGPLAANAYVNSPDVGPQARNAYVNSPDVGPLAGNAYVNSQEVGPLAGSGYVNSPEAITQAENANENRDPKGEYVYICSPADVQ